MYMYILIYVDDLLIACTNIEEVIFIKDKLSNYFKMKDLDNIISF